jgi:hypothetical protein
MRPVRYAIATVSGVTLVVATGATVTAELVVRPCSSVAPYR